MFTMSDNDLIQQQEKDSIIKELEAGIAPPGTTIPGVCAYHGSLARGMVWMIRRIDSDATPGGKLGVFLALLRASPWAVVVITGMVLLYMWATGTHIPLATLGAQ
jgi:hypothetical protein